MKKLLTLVAVLFASATLAHAQFGVIAGVNFSRTNLENTNIWENVKTATLFHVGVEYKVNMGLGFALQPALTYEMKGASLDGGKILERDLDTKSGYLELGLGLQWGPDLVIGRPFVFLQPFVGYQIISVDKTEHLSFNSDAVNDALDAAKNKLEYGFGVGVGFELFKHVQLSVQYFMNLGNLYTDGSIDGNRIWDSIKSGYKDIKNYNGVKVTLGYLF